MSGNQLAKIIAGLKYFVLIIVVIFSCAENKSQRIAKEEIIAKVGDRIITVDEFKYSFEFSFAPLRRGGEPRSTYLDFMINELLISNEGFRQGFHKHPYVTKRVARRRYNNLLEAFYLKHVHSRVSIPEEELQEATKKSTVKWRMIIWPTTTLEKAYEALTEARQNSLQDYIENKIANQEVKLSDKRFYETDWVDFLDLRPEIFDKIKDLEIGMTSDPFSYGNGYAIAQILDIHLTGIKEDELKYGIKRKQMQSRLHNIESDRIVHALMDSIITPLDVRVKGRVVEQLAPPLYQWINDGLPKNESIVDLAEEASDSAKLYLTEIKTLLNQTLIAFEGGRKSVKDYLQHMNYYRKALNQSESFENFRDRLITEIGRMVKNDIFIGIAEKEGYADSTNIVQDLELWERKWTYDVFRHHLVKDVEVTEEEMKKYFKYRWRELDIANIDTSRFYKYENDVFNAILYEKHMACLEKKLDEYRRQYPVWINEELLKKLDLSDSPKSRLTSLFLRKNFSGEPVVPTVAMEWIHF